MKIIVTIEARMGSTRLPGKVLKEVCGKPLLQHMIERLRRSEKVDDVVVATTVNPKDNAIEALCHKIACSYYRGSENDITQRLIDTAKHFEADLIVQTTGDCPLHDPFVIDEAVTAYLGSKVEYVSNRLVRTYPTGLDTQVYSPKVLQKVTERTQDATDREHGSYYIYTHPKEFTMKNFSSSQLKCPEKRWCLDYPEDFTLIQKVYEALYPTNPTFDTFDILRFLEKNPELEKINQMHPVDIRPYEYFEIL